MLVAFSSTTIADHVSIALNSGTSHERGKALEDLVEYIFRNVPGVYHIERDKLNASRSEEVDLAVWQDKYPDGLPFLRYDFLIECKNWTSSVSANEIVVFADKIAGRAIDFGILVTSNWISGDANIVSAAHAKISEALRKGIRVVVINLSELASLKDTNELANLLKKKHCELLVYGTVYP